jgi:hypothetical protein
MNRREALASLTALAGATGMSVTPVTAKDAEQCVLIILKPRGMLSADAAYRLGQAWEHATKDTPLKDVKAIVLEDGVDVEFVRH